MCVFLFIETFGVLEVVSKEFVNCWTGPQPSPNRWFASEVGRAGSDSSEGAWVTVAWQLSCSRLQPPTLLKVREAQAWGSPESCVLAAGARVGQAAKEGCLRRA